MNLEELADEAKKENIISVVSLMSKVDGKLHENEIIYILKLGLSFGLTDEKVREIIMEDDAFIFIPKTEQERMTVFYYLIFLAAVDDEIQKEEEYILHHFGLKLGFNPLMINNIISLVRSKVGERILPNMILNEAKKYMN